MYGTTRQVQIRQKFIQKPRQQSHHAALALALLAQKQHVMARQQGKADFRNHGVLVAHHAGKQLFTASQQPLEILLNLLFD